MAWVTVKIDSLLTAGEVGGTRTAPEDRYFVGQVVLEGPVQDVECNIECTHVTVANQVRDALNAEE